MKKKKRDTIYLQYKCKDGSRTVASTASVGLMYWYGRTVPQKPIENPKPFEVYVVATSMPAPYSPVFLPLVIAAMERTFGKALDIPAHWHDAAHYEKLPDKLDFHEIEKHREAGTPEIVEYEQICLDILHWLKEYGDITDLALNEPMKPFSW